MVERASLCHDGGGASLVEAASSAFVAWHGHLCFCCLKHSALFICRTNCALLVLSSSLVGTLLSGCSSSSIVRDSVCCAG